MRSLSLLYLAEWPALSEKLVSVSLSKVEDYKQIQPSDAGVVKEKFAHLVRSVLPENKGYFSEYNFKSDSLDEF